MWRTDRTSSSLTRHRRAAVAVPRPKRRRLRAPPGAIPAPANLTRMAKRLYFFEEGNLEMKDVLGGKGAGLAEMTRAGMPVPPGFTITTEACLDYYRLGRRFPDGLNDEIKSAMRELEKRTAKGFGSRAAPVLGYG